MNHSRLSWLLVALLVGSPLAMAQKFAGLANTPQMGWNSWNKFGCNVSEQLIRETADALVSSGMKDAGYQYVNIDDCWHGERDARGFIQVNAQRFPSGMKALADYVHARGLKLGLYSDAGWKTCGGRPGSRGHEYQDALTYAQWGVDYLKYDWCDTNGLKAEGAYLTMREALRAAGRPVLFSLCEWGDSKPWEWAKDVGHSWRTTGDIYPCFDCIQDHGTWKSWGVLQILDKQDGLRKYAGPDHWNDMDMLEVGNGMSVNEDRAHFSIWAMMASPLITGNDVRSMSKETAGILTNKSMIAVSQDALGVQAFRHAARDGLEYWFKPLAGGAWAFMALNRNQEARRASFDWMAEKVVDELSGRALDAGQSSYQLRNIWTGAAAGSTKKALSAEVPGHDALMLRLSAK
ncbi:MAG TPA: glycoside hydrolase family 27 protein [Steroidobacteraceae bacterium]|nr:glycoside hydrolase family 27 protein [Steroidobacteraceae bacterium]